MVDKRQHRGKAPGDDELFSKAAIENLQLAVGDYSLLLGKGYGEKSSLKLVGDRFELTARQRTAVMRCSCSDQQLSKRKKKQLKISKIKKDSVAIDGYNVIITIESALSGGYIFEGKDGCYRDLASLHGTYRKVTETIDAIKMIVDFIKSFGPEEVIFLLDKPVSNSGKLKQIIEETAQQRGVGYSAALFNNPDDELILGSSIAATSDSAVLDRCGRWINLAREMIDELIPDANIIELSM
jgi:hypothetical protein